MLIVKVSQLIPATASAIYPILSDYETGHPAILPKPEFEALRVTRGGYGEGTRFELDMRVMGQFSQFEMDVTEPEPGYILQETDIHTGQYSSFTLDDTPDGQCHVTITAGVPLEKGFAGVMQKLFMPTIIRRLFQRELDNLAEYVTAQHRVQVSG